MSAFSVLTGLPPRALTPSESAESDSPPATLSSSLSSFISSTTDLPRTMNPADSGAGVRQEL